MFAASSRSAGGGSPLSSRGIFFGRARYCGGIERKDRPRPADADGDRQGGHQGGHRGHHDGAEPDETPFVDRLLGPFPSLRSASRAKSIIMMAFFFTIPTSMMTPHDIMR